MKKIIISLVMTGAIVAQGWTARISNVQVDFLKGYAKDTINVTDTAYDYMGRLTYTFLAQGKDSVFLSFAIVNQSTLDSLIILEKTGDAGLIKQKNTGDTLKTVYFRTRLINDISGNYIARVTADTNISRMRKIADSLVQLMTLDQRQSTLYLAQSKQWFGSEDFQLGSGTTIVGWRCADGPHGVRYPIGLADDIAIYGSGDPATLFPTEAALANTWDTSLIYRVGWGIARESRAKGIYCNLGPMCDLVINPRWGRAFETMGEDPYLSGRMVSRRITGTQSERVIATPKHFAPYLKEALRLSTGRVVISERALRELFCVPFEMAILDGGARAIMSCYNLVRVPGYTTDDVNLISQKCETGGINRHLITDILRNDWGFDGIIMSDWYSLRFTSNAEYAYTSDLDMSNPEGDGGFTEISANINASIYSPNPLNKKAANVMYGKLWAWNGRLITSESEISTGYPQSMVLSPEHLNIALDAARKSIVLAKNDSVAGNRVLPLNKNATFRLAVVGPYANEGRRGGGGSSAVTPDSIISPILGIQRIIAGHPNITLDTNSYTGADIAIVFVGTIAGLNGECESVDRQSLFLETSQLSLVTSVKAAVPRTIVVYTGGSASIEGSWSSAPAVLIAFYPGRWQGQAIAEVLFGDINPSGHLAVTFPKTENDLPGFDFDVVSLELNYPRADTAHGYFYFEKTGKTPLFWFGHGLSYTAFTYNSIKVFGGHVFSSGDRIDVAVSITNSGTVAGDDVVQLYVKPNGSTVPRRVKDLRGFCRVSLAAGETKTVTFTLGPRDFSIYEAFPATKSGRWSVMPGSYDLIAGSTSNPNELVDGNGKCVVTPVTVQ